MKIDMQVLITQLETFLILIGFGFFACKSRLLTQELHDKLNTIIMRVIIPALLISNMVSGSGDENIKLFLPMIAGGALVFLLLYLMGTGTATAMGLKGDKRSVQVAVTTFGSTGFFGIPLAMAVMGSTGGAAFGIFSIVDNIVVWTLGLALSRGKGDSDGDKMSWRLKAKKIIQPATVSVFIGLILLLFRAPSDLLVIQCLGKIGNCSSPLAMICIGASIARCDFRKLYQGWPCLSVILIKMILAPMLVYYAAVRLNVYQPAVICLTLLAALPSSSMFSLMCKDNGNEAADYAAQAAIITVFASMGTLPLVAWLLR